MAEQDPLSEFELDYSSGLPVWVQLKNRISYLIATNKYSQGDQLPTVRKLAVDLDISYNTVNRAYMDLEREGFITTRKGRGTFVAAPPNGIAIDSGHVELVVDDMIRTCRNSGMSTDDILAIVKRRLDE